MSSLCGTAKRAMSLSWVAVFSLRQLACTAPIFDRHQENPAVLYGVAQGSRADPAKNKGRFIVKKTSQERM